MARADEATAGCDLFVVLGPPLWSIPQPGFPRLAKRHGAKLVIVNREPTEQDGIADLAIHAEIGPTLSAAVNAL